MGERRNMIHYGIRYVKRGRSAPITVFYNSQTTNKEVIVQRARFMWGKREENKITGITVVAYVEQGTVYNGGDPEEIVQKPAVESKSTKPRRPGRGRVRKT